MSTVNFVCDYSCILFEIQSPGIEADAGAQFQTKRLYITCALFGESLAVILIVDGVEYLVGNITCVGRQTIELPYERPGRFLDGIRLTGRVCKRVEVFRIEADVWYGNEWGSELRAETSTAAEERLIDRQAAMK